MSTLARIGFFLGFRVLHSTPFREAPRPPVFNHFFKNTG